MGTVISGAIKLCMGSSGS